MWRFMGWRKYPKSTQKGNLSDCMMFIYNTCTNQLDEAQGQESCIQLPYLATPFVLIEVCNILQQLRNQWTQMGNREVQPRIHHHPVQIPDLDFCTCCISSSALHQNLQPPELYRKNIWYMLENNAPKTEMKWVIDIPILPLWEKNPGLQYIHKSL